MRLTLIAIALAVYASANPIGVTGSGTIFDGAIGINLFSVSFFGSDGVNSVSAGCEQSGPPFFCKLVSGSSAGANIDGQHFSAGFYTFQLGDGGSITGYDSALNPVITQAISGYEQITSQVCTGTFGARDCTTTFDVVPTPESSTWILTAAGLAGLLYWRRMANPIAK